MKINLILFSIFVLLLSGTYLFHEKKNLNDLDESLVRDHLFLTEEINSIEWRDVELIKKNDQWFLPPRFLASHNGVKQLLKRISQLKKIKEINGEKVNYFNSKINIKVNNKKIELGDFNLDRSALYVCIDGKTILVTMEGVGEEIISEDQGSLEIKFADLKKILEQKKEEFLETQFFRYYPTLPLGKVMIEADGRASFEIDFINNKTIPSPFTGLINHENILSKFHSLLTQVTLKKEIPFDQILSTKKLATMTFIKEERKVVFDLRIKSASSADSYLVDSESRRAWQMVGGTLRIFFANVQDFWDKKIIPPTEFKNFRRLKVIFSQGPQSEVMEILNQNPLNFKSTQFKVQLTAMRELFDYVFNLNQKDQADRVSPLSLSEKKEIQQLNLLRLEIMGQELYFWQRKQELVIVNFTQGFKAHFFLAQEEFPVKFESVLK